MTDSFSDATDPANIIVPGSVQNGPFGPTSYNLGNGLTAVNTYDTLGRLSGGYACAGSSQPGCNGGSAQPYGYTAQRLGTHVTQSCDTVMAVCNSFAYDEFDRLTARTVTQGTVQNFTYGYDRYGNRWTQSAPQGGPTLSITFNQANNIIATSGFANDEAGNVTGDSFYAYAYDADGNLISVNNGQTATYYYDSLNQRVRIAPTRGTYEFVWDVFGRRVSNWAASNHSFVESNAYTDTNPIAIRSGGQTQFEHQNWLGTERVRTTYSGSVAISIGSLPWADDHTPSGDNGDQHDFAQTDRDLEDATNHAQYRQFSTNLGRWLTPDLYLGSYDLTNPQSLNRYSYVLNNPTNLVDPSGLDYGYDCGGNCVGVVGTDDCSTTTTTCIDPGSTSGDILNNWSTCDSNPITCGYRHSCPQCQSTPAPPTAPSNGVVHSFVCGVFSGLVNAANPQNLNSTIGVGVGGSAGVGFILGVAASVGVQAVADSHGNLGVAFNVGGNPGYLVFGAGATGGAQATYSTASSIYDLRGGSVGAGASAFNGELDASVGSGGVVTGTVTAGVGVGTKGSGLSLNYTFVPSALSTNCRQ